MRREAGKQRDANLDLLRLFSMFLIVLRHSIGSSGVLGLEEQFGWATFLYLRFVYMLSQVCVNLFVMLSGYYLVHSSFRFRKMIQLWLEVVFYSLFIKLVFMVSGEIPFSMRSLASCFLPVITGRYWFITVYMGLYLLFPFLNLAVKAMDKKTHLSLVLVLVLLFSVMISIYPSFPGMNSGDGWGLPWFVVLYFIAAWIRLYYTPDQRRTGRIAAWLGIALVISLLYCFSSNLAAPVKKAVGNWYRYDSLFSLASTVLVFLAFLNLRVQNRTLIYVIERAAPATLGVYLIHAHADLGKALWRTLNLQQFLGSPVFPLVQSAAVLGIFLVCILVDLLRSATVGRVESSRLASDLDRFADRKMKGFLQEVLHVI